MRLDEKYKKELLALVFAFAMSATSVLVGNCPYPFWDRIDWLCVAENLVRSLFGEEDDKEDAYFVNVGYDKQLVDIQVSAVETGQQVITNRKTLLDFLTIVERADYKYVFLDIRFEKGYNTEWDKTLFSKIASMNKVVCVNHYDDFEIADSLLLPKAAYNDYYTTVFSSNFTRYQYLQDNRPSVALRMYQEIDGKNVERSGILFFNDGTLSENCPYIPIKGGVSPPKGDGSMADYLNLGPFLMTQIKEGIINEEELIEDMKGKIIVVGDFNEDLHDTYMGMQPGPYLTYTAYKYLAKGGNKLSIGVLAFMTLVFFLIVRGKLRGRPVFPWGERFLSLRWMGWLRCLLRSRLIKFVGTFITYSVVLSFICTIFYLICESTFNVEIPALVITIISAVMDLQKKETT